MILVDTSIWVEHFSRVLPTLAEELEANNVLTHTFVLGELALGNLTKRAETLELLANLPRAEIAEDDEVMALIEDKKLFAKKIGWVDAHLIASAQLSDCSLWTLDRFLKRVADYLDVHRYS